MITKILKIRLIQLSRITSDLGIVRTVFIAGLLCFVSFFIFSSLSTKSNQEIITASYLLSILFIHFKRKDKTFLNLYAEKPYKIFLVEYFLLSIPLIISLIYYRLWNQLIIFTVFLIAISFFRINIAKISLNTELQKIIPDENFEWKSGIRKYLIIIIFIWLAGILTSFFVASVPVAIFILGIIFINFYETSESLQILISDELNTKKFLAKKIKNHFFIFSAINIPLVLAFIFFNPEYYYIVLAEYTIFSILLIYTILLKYAFYKPNIKSGAMQIFTTIGVISIFIPLFIPVILILSIKFLFQASNNLNFYLHDFN